MNPSTPKTELPPSTQLRKVVFVVILGILGTVALVVSARGDEASDFVKAQEAKALAHLAHDRETYKTAEAWAERTRVIREDFLKGQGLWPIPARPPVKVITHSRREHDGYSVENVALETVPGFYSVGNLYRPLGLPKPGPAILCPHGHFIPMKPGTRGGRFREEQQQRCAHFARMGATVFSYSMVGWQDSQQTTHLDRLGFPLQTWNSLRAVDYVLSLPNVDPERLGVTGASGGGTQALILALVEPRIRVCAPVVIVGLNASGCLCEGGVWTYTNFPEVAAMIAPRPLLLISNGDDWTRDFPTKGFPFVEHFYELAGGKGAVKNVHLPKEGHDFGPSKRKAVYEFFALHLKMPLMAEDNRKLAFETPDQMEVFNAKHSLPAHAVKGSEAVAAAFARMIKGGE